MKSWVLSRLIVGCALVLAGCDAGFDERAQSPEGSPSTMVSQLALEDCTAFGCPNGCVQLDYGVDDNANGALDAAEVDGTEYICHGATGETGAQGEPGAAGQDGTAGTQGPQGEPGTDGEDGDDGTQGPQGESGADGQDGADGAQGPQGESGADGQDGADGAQGPQGAPGAAGQDGADGAQGPQGEPGADGQDGADGAQGPQGEPGADGQDGEDGAQGPQGEPGADGQDGADGEDGSDCTVAQTDCQATLSCEDGTSVSWELYGCNCDNCGVCDFDTDNDCEQDCFGTWGGSALLDTCGICRADPADDCVQDCAGTWGGAASWDSCGVCDDDPTNDCVQDCAGMWGGNAVEDVCGTCDDDPTNDCVLTDCAGTLGGSAVLDDCGVCDEDDSNDNTTCQQDCAGTWGGAATVDNCGTCDDDPTNDCVQDCAGTWGGSAMTDDAGDCGYWTRETTLDCWHPVSANYIRHAGMTSQEECFEICLDEPGCDAIYQFKYANPSDSRSCFLFMQENCYDTGQMQPEINIVGWETWIWVPIEEEDTVDPTDDEDDEATISAACDFGILCYQYSIGASCPDDVIAGAQSCFDDPSATVVESCSGSYEGTLDTSDESCSVSTECYASDSNGEFACAQLLATQ